MSMNGRPTTSPNNKTIERPECVSEEHLVYLDDLRVSGITNMFGAAPYLAEEFDLDKDIAKKVLLYWMASFGERKAESKTPMKDIQDS